MAWGELGEAESAPATGSLLPPLQAGRMWGVPSSPPPQPSGRTCPGVAAGRGRPRFSPQRGEGAGEGGGFPAPLARRCLAARRRPRPDPPAAQPPRQTREPNLRAAELPRSESGPAPAAPPESPWSPGVQVSVGLGWGEWEPFDLGVSIPSRSK